MGTHGGTDDLLPAAAICACPPSPVTVAALGGGDPDDPSPRWQPLALADIPGLSELAGILEPPLQIVTSVLQFVKGVLEVISKLLIDFTDPFRALILAAYELLKEIVDSLLDTSVHAYFDAPGLTSMKASARELGQAVTPPSRWKAGQPSPVERTPGNFETWASRFQASFDDPGDAHRPVLSDGAVVEALFVVAAAPDLPDLRVFTELFGRLLNLDAFRNAVDKYPGIHGSDFTSDLDRFRVRGQSVAPDWVGVRLVDLVPVLEHLQHLPEVLKGLLLTVDNLIGLLKNLVDAVASKVDVLLQLAEAIQAVIDFIRSLAGAGFYGLAVSTDGGVEGLVSAFLEAEDRPPGEHMAGACVLAAGAAALPIWALLGQDGKFEAAARGLEAEWESLKAQGEQALEDALAEAEASGAELEEAADALHEAYLDHREQLEQAGEDLAALGSRLDTDRDGAVGALEGLMAAGAQLSPGALAAIELTRRARRRGSRALAQLAAREGDR